MRYSKKKNLIKNIQLKLKNNMESKLNVKYSDFQTDLSFNEWAQYIQASILWDEATNERNKQFIEKYRNYKFAEAFPAKPLSLQPVC
jgi:hypothetical protein